LLSLDALTTSSRVKETHLRWMDVTPSIMDKRGFFVLDHMNYACVGTWIHRDDMVCCRGIICFAPESLHEGMNMGDLCDTPLVRNSEAL